MALAEYEIDPATFQNTHLEEGRIYAVFFTDPLHDEAASLEQGRPIYRDTEFVRIVSPGDKTNVVVRPARNSDRDRFPRQYAAFKRGEPDQVVGTPLTQWSIISRAQSEEFKALGVMTVEHLSELRDDIKLKIPGALQLSQRAKDWLAASADSGVLSKMRTEREEQDERIATLEKQLEEMKKSFKPAAAGK